MFVVGKGQMKNLRGGWTNCEINIMARTPESVAEQIDFFKRGEVSGFYRDLVITVE